MTINPTFIPVNHFTVESAMLHEEEFNRKTWLQDWWILDTTIAEELIAYRWFEPIQFEELSEMVKTVRRKIMIPKKRVKLPVDRVGGAFFAICMTYWYLGWFLI